MGFGTGYSGGPSKAAVNAKVFVAAIMGVMTSSLPAGFNLGVVNTPQVVLKKFCNETLHDKGIELTADSLEVLWSVVVAILLVGAIIGAAVAGWMADRLGRKFTVLLNSIVGLAAAALFAVADAYSLVAVLLIGRFVAGIHCGLGSSVVPMYLMEVAPKSLRGAMGVMQQLGLTSGILIAQVLGQETYLGSEYWWSTLLSFSSIFIALGLVALSFCPESPVYLYVIQGEADKAVRVLRKVRMSSGPDFEEEIRSLRAERKNQESEHWSLISMFKSRATLIPLLLLCAMHLGQQLSGINAVFYYSTMTFSKIGMSKDQAALGSIGAGCVNALMAIFAVPLVNCCRRRTLMLTSIAGSTLFLWTLTASLIFGDIPWMPYVTIGSFMGFVMTFGIGLGPVPFLIGAELFPQGPRSMGMSMGCLTNWATNLLIAFTFPILQSILNEKIFIIFSAFTIGLGLIIFFWLPETRGLSQSRIATLFTDGRHGLMVPDDQRSDEQTMTKSSYIVNSDATSSRASTVYSYDEFLTQTSKDAILYHGP